MTIWQKLGKALAMIAAGLLGLIAFGVAWFFALIITDPDTNFVGSRFVYLALSLGGVIGALSAGWAVSALLKNYFWKAFVRLVFTALVCYPGVAIILDYVELAGVKYSP